MAVRRCSPLIAWGRRTGVGRGEWQAKFKIFQDRDGRYYRHLEAASGRIIAQSGHPCESEYRCEQDVNWLRANAGLIMGLRPHRATHRLVA